MMLEILLDITVSDLQTWISDWSDASHFKHASLSVPIFWVHPHWELQEHFRDEKRGICAVTRQGENYTLQDELQATEESHFYGKQEAQWSRLAQICNSHKFLAWVGWFCDIWKGFTIITWKFGLCHENQITLSPKKFEYCRPTGFVKFALLSLLQGTLTRSW